MVSAVTYSHTCYVISLGYAGHLLTMDVSLKVVSPKLFKYLIISSLLFSRLYAIAT